MTNWGSWNLIHFHRSKLNFVPSQFPDSLPSEHFTPGQSQNVTQTPDPAIIMGPSTNNVKQGCFGLVFKVVVLFIGSFVLPDAVLVLLTDFKKTCFKSL